MRRSFSSEVRDELCKSPIEGRHCALAELAAFIPSIGEGADGEIVLHSEQTGLRRRFSALMQYAFPFPASAQKILSATGTEARGAVNPAVIMHSCCKRAYVRGCFITAGTVNAPGRNYHLEFSFPFANGDAMANQLKKLLNIYEINAKLRNDQPLVYVKEAENIVETLRFMGASKSLLRFENERVTKELANGINRRVNCETANLSKTVNAAVLQVNDIKFIAEHAGLSYLPAPLQEVARLRLEYETASLHEIGAMLSPGVSKSGVNHRLRKINEIAEELRRKEGYE